MRILLVEDDPVLSDMLARYLSDAGHRLDIAPHLAAARHFWLVQKYDAVLLDLNLPLDERSSSQLGSGLGALREARARGDTTPVLVLTARSRTDERIAGLNAGADDYLGKPFDLDEMEARLRALLRRSQGTSDVVQIGLLQLSRQHRRFTVNDQALDLPAREFEVLFELMSPPGRVVSKTELASKLSSFDELLADNALEAFISRLRKKLQGSQTRIRTLRGLGYMIEPDDA
jgi:two-component system, OmpR family, response regulator